MKIENKISFVRYIQCIVPLEFSKEFIEMIRIDLCEFSCHDLSFIYVFNSCINTSAIKDKFHVQICGKRFKYIYYEWNAKFKQIAFRLATNV